MMEVHEEYKQRPEEIKFPMSGVQVGAEVNLH